MGNMSAEPPNAAFRPCDRRNPHRQAAKPGGLSPTIVGAKLGMGSMAA
tara:strand:+ start:3304 stop:3447 length:144 start_codon:yes stop_codon:yes gene_type:complete